MTARVEHSWYEELASAWTVKHAKTFPTLMRVSLSRLRGQACVSTQQDQPRGLLIKQQMRCFATSLATSLPLVVYSSASVAAALVGSASYSLASYVLWSLLTQHICRRRIHWMRLWQRSIRQLRRSRSSHPSLRRTLGLTRRLTMLQTSWRLVLEA